ncbi:GGDEF domain-containing protein [Butyrivibrio proteoclasticus]|uniref:GGDEF domain-containing protein n=1 Tax=Butyrivibrio proteoclasticus TaxID=43305 RepID=UPI00047EF9C5|nr:GGDEF domain-containing protein [Butyrivibrio proteoclasticus]
MNIGLLISELEDKEVKKICVGASMAAKDKGITLVLLPGRYLLSDKAGDTEDPYEYQYTALFDYAKTSNFDALIIDIDRIGKKMPILKKEALLNKFEGIPVLTLTEQEGYPFVNQVESDHDQLQQQGYEAVCDAIYYAHNNKLPDPEPIKNFSFVEKSSVEALESLSDLGYKFLKRKYADEKAYQIIAAKAKENGINNFGILLYDKKVKNTIKYNWKRPDQIRLKGAIIGGEEEVLEKEKSLISTEDIFSKFASNKVNILIAGVIFVGEYQLGIMVSEFSSNMMTDNYFENLLSIITGASRISYLERELKNTREELIEVQEELARDDSVLDHIGDQDYLTGGLNRRGFFAKAYDLLKDNFIPGTSAIVAYIHMESLKGINEMFGHEEGDRAVKRVSEILESVFGDSIYGRIRGDEFAVIDITDEIDKAETLRQEMTTQNARLLAESARYMNHLRFSICEFGYDENLSLRDMLRETDESLQKIKSNLN